MQEAKGTIELRPFQELRLEVGRTQKLSVELLHGTCEIKGQELIENRRYEFTGINTFIFTYYGCSLRVEGESEIHFVSKNSNMREVFEFFDQVRSEKKKKYFIMGNGRSTFITTIANYFVRIHKKVRVTEVDPKNGFLVFPGVLGGVTVENFIDFHRRHSFNEPKLFYYGEKNVTNVEQYKNILNKLDDFAGVELLLVPNDLKVLEILQTEIEAEAEVLVLGDERLFNYVKSPQKCFIPNSGYFPEQKKASDAIHWYFHGLENEYTPYTLSLDNATAVRIGEEFLAPTSALPLGASRKIDTNEIKEVEIVKDAVLGISAAERLEDVKDKPVLGFVAVHSVGAKLKALCPQGRLPKFKYFVQGELRYNE